MAAEKKIITVRQGDKVIYEGPDNRKAFDESRAGLPWGLRAADLIHLTILAVSVLTFVIKTDERLKMIEKSSAYLVDFAEASDGWHSTMTGTRFKGGAPIDGAFNPNRKLLRLEKENDREPR